MVPALCPPWLLLRRLMESKAEGAHSVALVRRKPSSTE